ncbi:hypothetical protein EKO04_009286 [Ascochyta lentis]|uniref:Uncharacterized protein n=1 Tax=Ascochyta lentis TaxID=205686 RepID=A0A8H7IY18_9PLEO|nr:hypothetical protein EKO04_009286 [Ascochyta lentis]
MASVKPEPKPPAAPGNPNLDMLQGMLNMVLLTTGRFIKEHHAGGGTGRMKQGMQRAVPAATDRFHDALDELENEVRLAQTVLRRDLALLKQDRKKREAAAKHHEAERARLAAESSLSVPAKTEQVAVKPESTSPAEQPDAQPPAEQPARAESPEAVPKVEEEAEQPPAPDTTTAPPADPLFDDTPTNPNAEQHEFDFDFEFGDAMDTSGNHDNPGHPMDTSGDMDFNLDEGPSLLRGLEDFAKSGEGDDHEPSTNMDLDFPMPDLPDTNTDAKPPGEQPKPAEPTPQPAPPPEDTKDSKPDQEAADAKPASDANDTKNIADEPMETMTTDNLEDLFNNLDDYDNPEGDSAFNDAFFNFD